MNKSIFGVVAALSVGTVLTGCFAPRPVEKKMPPPRVVVPKDTTAEQISNRVARLVSGTAKALKQEGPSAARKFVYEFGIAKNVRVDIPVARVKWGLLNSWVNPRDWDLRRAELNAKQEDFLKRGDLDGLIAFLRQEKQPAVAAYSEGVDKSIGDIQGDVKRMGAIGGDADELEAKKRAQIQRLLDNFRGAYEAEARKDPDFTQLEKLLKVLNGQLQAQDLSEADAEAFCKIYGAEAKALVAKAEAARRAQRPNMTTRQLNEKIHKWYETALENALLAKDLAEKVEAEAKARKEDAAEAEKAKKSFVVRLYAMRQATEGLDLDRYIAYAEDAIPKAEEANRALLGDYARTLRLAKRGKLPISREEAAAVLAGAALFGQPEMTDYAKALGASSDDVSRYDGFRRPAIVLAVQGGDLATVKALVKSGADVNKSDGNGETALVLAARKGRVGIAKALMAAKASINAKGNGGDTALIAAARAGNTELIGALSAAGADAQSVSKNDRKQTAWMAALEANRLNAVKVLLAGRPAQTGDAPTALDLAVKTDDAATVEYALAAWKIRDPGLLTAALPVAAKNGCLSVVKVLVSNGAEITDAAMVASVQSGNLATVKYIVRNGGNVQAAKAEAKAKTTAPAIREYLKGQGL